MKLKSISLLLLLPALMLVLVACTSGPSEADINATVEARVKAVLTAVPTATPPPETTVACVATLDPAEMGSSADPGRPTPTPYPDPTPLPTVTRTPIPTATLHPAWRPAAGYWIPITVELDRIVHESGMGIYDYLLVVITNPNPHPGSVTYRLESEDENGTKLVGNKYGIDGTGSVGIAVPPNAKSVTLHTLRFDLDEIIPAKWLLRAINSDAHSYGQWEEPYPLTNWLQRGTPIGDPQQTGNEFFDLDGIWLTNKTDKKLEISYYVQYDGRTLTRQPDLNPLVFEKFPDITTFLGHQFAIFWLEPNTKQQIEIDGAVLKDSEAEADKELNRATHSWNVYQCSSTCFARDD